MSATKVCCEAIIKKTGNQCTNTAKFPEGAPRFCGSHKSALNEQEKLVPNEGEMEKIKALLPGVVTNDKSSLAVTTEVGDFEITFTLKSKAPSAKELQDELSQKDKKIAELEAQLAAAKVADVE